MESRWCPYAMKTGREQGQGSAAAAAHEQRLETSPCSSCCGSIRGSRQVTSDSGTVHGDGGGSNRCSEQRSVGWRGRAVFQVLAESSRGGRPLFRRPQSFSMRISFLSLLIAPTLQPQAGRHYSRVGPAEQEVQAAQSSS